LLTRHFGITGTAVAWSFRVAVDALLLFFFCDRLLPQKPGFLLKLSVVTTGALTILVLVSMPGSTLFRVILLALGLPLFGFVGWSRGLGPTERLFLAKVRTEVPTRVQTN